MAERFQAIVEAGHPPPVPSYTLAVGDYYNITEEEKTKLDALDVRRTELAADEKQIREDGQQALKVLEELVKMLFATSLGAIGLSAFHNKRVPSWVTATATLVAIFGFGLAVGAAIYQARHRLFSLKWPLHVLRARKVVLHGDVKALVSGFHGRNIYLDIEDCQKTKDVDRHVAGDSFLKQPYSGKVHSMLSSSGHSEDLICTYNATMWGYGVIAVVLLTAAVLGVVLGLVKTKD